MSHAPLMLVHGDATDEEVAALVAVLHRLTATTPTSRAPAPRSTWASPTRRLRTAHHPGPGAWRASALPVQP
jgi:hypothetical protein